LDATAGIRGLLIETLKVRARFGVCDRVVSFLPLECQVEADVIASTLSKVWIAAKARFFRGAWETGVARTNAVRVIEAFVEGLDLGELGFGGVDPKATGRPAYHPSVLLKLYIYGYLNRVQSSRRLEREAGRNVEVMWLTGRLAPDHKTIADFRKDNGAQIRKVCARFVALCRRLGLLATASVAIDGSKFEAVNNRDRNFTAAKMKRRREQIEESVARYLQQLDSADRQEPSEALAMRFERFKALA
jgi:transposase